MEIYRSPVKFVSLVFVIIMFGSLFLFNLLVLANSETEKVFSTKDDQIIRKSQMVLDERNFDKITR